MYSITFKKFVIFILTIFVLIALLTSYFWFKLAPPNPKITSHKFSFKLCYEYNGEIITIEDVAVIKYDGYSFKTTAGPRRKWIVNTENGTPTIEDNALCIKILDLSNQERYDAYGNRILELYFYGGNGHFYMNDKLGDLDRNEQDNHEIYYRYKKDDGTIGHSSFDEKNAFDEYKIRLLSWKCDQPIENDFV